MLPPLDDEPDSLPPDDDVTALPPPSVEASRASAPASAFDVKCEPPPAADSAAAAAAKDDELLLDLCESCECLRFCFLLVEELLDPPVGAPVIWAAPAAAVVEFVSWPPVLPPDDEVPWWLCP